MKNFLLLLIGCLFSLSSFAQGNALNFDGVDEHVTLITGNGLPIANNSSGWTVEMWVNSSSGSGNEYVYQEANAGNSFFGMHDNGSGKVRVFMRNTLNVIQIDGTSTTTVFDGSWNHIALVHTGAGSATLYVNGVADATNFNYTASGTVLNTTSSLAVQNINGTKTLYYSGQLDEVRVWNLALTASQVLSLYNDTFSDPTTPASCLVAYYQMNENTGSSASDGTGNGNTGTLVNMENVDWVASTAGVTSLSAPTCASLPVELTFFNAKAISNQINLTWQTATELINEGFEIQKTVGDAALAAGRWEVLAFVEGRGTTNEIQNYDYTDEHPQAGLNYYRLKQIDFDGKFEFSDIVLVEMRGNPQGSGGGIQIFPNPAPSDELTLYLPESDDGKATIRLYDQTGKLALQQTTSSQQVTLKVSQLSAGIYFVEVTVGGKIFREKVMVE